jgi:hypothetical protein
MGGTVAVHGTWKVTGGGGGGTAVRLGAGAVAAAVLLSWLATVLWLLAVIGAVLLVIAAALTVGLVMILRRPRDEAERLAAQAAALRVDVAPKVIEPYGFSKSEMNSLADGSVDSVGLSSREAQSATVIHYHGGTHLHLEPGTDPDIIRHVIAREARREKEIY